ncbi:MAG: AsmA-like C-terminal region-containing protein, partial [Nitrospinaceae bacterium]
IHSADPELVVRASSDRFKHTDFAGVPFLEKLVYQGPAKVEFIWQSNNENRKFENHVDLQRVAYSYGDYFSKPAGAANRIVVKGRVLPQGGLALDDVIFELEGNRVTGHAKVDNPEDPTFAAHLESKDFETLKAAPFIHALASNRGGRMEFILDGTGRVRDLENGKLRGTAFLRQLEFKPEGFVHPFTLDAEVKWSEDLYDIREGALSSDRTHVDFSGRYKNGLKPHLDLVLTGKELNLEHLLPEESGTGQGKGASRWRTTRLFAQGSGSFDLRLDRFDYGVWSLPQVVGKVAFKDRVLQFEQLDVGKEKVNQVRAQGSVTFAPSQPAVFEGLFLAYNVQAEGFFGHFGNLFEKSLSGRLNWLKARVNSRGDSLQEVLDNLEGNLSVDLSDGFIQTARLREGARRLFEFPGEDAPVSLDEPAHSYIDIFGDFEVKSGVAHTENFLYEDKNKRLSLVGDFDLNRYAMDTVVGVAPLRELDRVLTKIPLVGKIITAGDEQSLFKNYYRVRGPFKDPDVSPVPFTSLGKKVIGIFQGILQAPTELFPPPAISRNRPSLPAPRP